MYFICIDLEFNLKRFGSYGAFQPSEAKSQNMPS